MVFDNIKNINVNKENDYKDNIYVTLDVDWASDEVLAFTLDCIDKNDLHATIFCTHDTQLIKRMRENPKIGLGIHPNFNKLGNYSAKRLKKIT